MTHIIHGSGSSVEEAVENALREIGQNHLSGEVMKILLDHGGVRGGTEFRVEIRIND